MQVLIGFAPDFIAILALVFLFWFVFVIIGINVFGGMVTDFPTRTCNGFIICLITMFDVGSRPAAAGCMHA